jgi:ankyrin repeat protein
MQDSPSKAGDNKSTPYNTLMACALVGSTKGVQQAIRAGADVNGQWPDDGETALHQAAQNGHIECARILRDAGARADIQDSDGWLPHEKAAAHGHASAFIEMRAWYIEDKRRHRLSKVSHSTPAR